MECRPIIGENKQSASAISDLQQCVESTEPLSVVRGKVDLLSQLCSSSEICQVFEALRVDYQNYPREEMRVLIAFGYWFCSHDIALCKPVMVRLPSLISPDRPGLSVSVFALHCFYYCYLGDYVRAVAALEAGLDWIELHHIKNPMLIYHAIFLLANRLGHDEMALQSAYKSYDAAFASEDSAAIELAKFSVIVCNHFLHRAHVDVGYDFEKSLSVVEKGQSEMVLINQQFLTLGAAFAELHHKQPDLEKVERLLAQTLELGVSLGANHVQRTFHLVNAKMHLCAGSASSATVALNESLKYRDSLDSNLDKEHRLLCTQLGIEPPAEVALHTLPKKFWRGLEARLLQT